MKVTTNMKGFQGWMKQHPRERLDGYFAIGDRLLTHSEVIKVVNYAVEHGYKTDADIPSDVISNLLDEKL